MFKASATAVVNAMPLAAVRCVRDTAEASVATGTYDLAALVLAVAARVRLAAR